MTLKRWTGFRKAQAVVKPELSEKVLQLSVVIDDKNKSLERKVIFSDAISPTSTISQRQSKTETTKGKAYERRTFLINLSSGVQQ